MNDLEDKLSRVLAGAAGQAPQASTGLSAAVEAGHRRRRARTTALLAAAAVIVVIGGAGTAVNVIRTSAVPRPAVSAPQPTVGKTTKPAERKTDRAQPPVDKIPPSIEEVWPQAVRKIPARLPDGRAYYPQLLLDDHTLLVMTGRVGMTGRYEGERQFLWSYDLNSGEPRKIAEIPPTKDSAIYADGVAAGGGNIVWWASYKETGKQRVARIWTVPAGGGTPRLVTEVPLENVMKKGHINGLAVVGSDVVFAYEKGGVYRVPLSGGQQQPVKGAERHHILEWPWVGVHRRNAIFGGLLNVETGERRDAVVKAGEQVRCGVSRCSGVAVRKHVVRRKGRDFSWEETTRSFVRDRDGSRERELPRGFQIGDDPGLERFFKVMLNGPDRMSAVALYDSDTGRSADLGVRPDAGGIMGIPDGGPDRLMAYPVGDKMYVVDLAAIE
ncbi:TolB family protein [Streptosporangium sp. NPDC000396]|uniref:TolB family protein n=1 Tax=Streptosporangium sp. NPDC000396 TaxID=3366185 RepID=UPI0036979BD6